MPAVFRRVRVYLRASDRAGLCGCTRLKNRRWCCRGDEADHWARTLLLTGREERIIDQLRDRRQRAASTASFSPSPTDQVLAMTYQFWEEIGLRLSGTQE